MRTHTRFMTMALVGLMLAGLAGPPIAEVKIGVHDATIPAPREAQWWTTRHARFNEIATTGDIDLVFLGDSITQGWEGNGKGVWAEQYGPESGRKTANFGIGGDRTQHVLWRIDNGNFEGITPKLIVLMIGTNNSGDNTPREIADGVIAILQKLRVKVPGAKILTLAIFPRGADNTDAKRKTNHAANAIIKNCADDDMIHYLDIGSTFLEKDKTLTKEIMPDLLHLSEDGYARWASAIEEKVAELLGEE
jgi:lysophospholipase L1-like esterase